MFLKSVKITNYRKFGEENNSICFAHQKEKRNVSERTTLFVGKNNSGKTSIIHLLSRLAQSRANSSGQFTIHDINYASISKFYSELLEKGPDNLSGFPAFEVELEIGFSNIYEKKITSLKDVLYIEQVESIEQIFENDLPKNSVSNQNTTIIKVSFEPRSLSTYQKKSKEFYDLLKSSKIEDTWLRFGINVSEEIQNAESLENKSVLNFLKDPNKEADQKNRYQFTKNYYFKKYLTLLEESNYVIKVYPHQSDEPVESFDFSTLFSIQVVEANLLTSSNTLTKSYNQIVKNMIMGNESKTKEFNESKDSLNYQIYKSFLEVVEIVNKSVSEIESPGNLKMALESALNLDLILNHATTYSYQDGNYYVPESQFGLGYTNLMLIVAKLTEYFELYGDENIDHKINLIAIEEPESFMHPQMQENFILYIENAINQLIKGFGEKEVSYQMLISTHSSHVLNSKLHSGNTFDHINYFRNCSIQDGITAEIYPLSDQSINSSRDSDSFKFVKKHVELEMSDIFFADAVILVEGITEELYLKYLLKEREPYCTKLGKYHIKVYKINGAHAKVYLDLLNTMKIPSVILTDMDYKRNRSNNNNYSQIQDIENDLRKIQEIPEGELTITTNSTFEEVIKSTNESILGDIDPQKDMEFFKFELTDSLSAIFTQGKINDFYATSFEEALILQNVIGSKKEKMEKLLKKVFPKKYAALKENNVEERPFCLTKHSYELQTYFTGSYKTKLIHTLIQEEISDNDFRLEVPSYIVEAFNYLEQKLEGDYHG